MQQMIGVKISDPHASQRHNLGARYVDEVNGKEYIYVKADSGGVTAAGYAVLIDETFAADMIETTNSATGYGQLVGIAPAAVTANYYFWAQVFGVASIRVAASAAANVALNTTATAGQIDDDATTGAEIIEGIALTTANGVSAGTAAGLLLYPRVRATL